MKKYSITIGLLVFSVYTYAQGTAGVGKKTVNIASVLDLTNTTNKAFVPPRVAINDPYSNTTPVANPADGLIVYNTNTPKGFYIWNKGAWNLMATKENSVTNAIIQNTSKVTGVSLSAIGVFTPISMGVQAFNSISGFSVNGSDFTLPPGNYSVQVALNIQVPSETTADGVGNTVRTNIHNYTAKLTNGPTVYGLVMADSQASNTSSTANSKQHVANFSFSFQITATTTMSFNLARAAGGTYSGNIDILNSFIHIQHGML